MCILQEEERERRMDFVPEESAVNTETIEVSNNFDTCIELGYGITDKLTVATADPLSLCITAVPS